MRHLVGRLGDPAALRACYEAGPCGFELHRLLSSMGVACDVVAPSLIPRRAGDRVKTDKRDASRLARLHRAGELTPIRVPPTAEEAVRDLVRVRAALLADRKRAQQRITAMLLRHGRVWRSGSYWTQAHEQWIAGQRFGEPALAAALAHYRAALDTRRAELDAIEAELAAWAARPAAGRAVARLGCYRGIAELNGLTLAAEVGDWRRFPSARAFMGFTGLVPAEYSSGDKTRRGSITKAGSEPVRTALVEAAWAYRFQPAIGVTLAPPATGRGPRHPGPLLAGAAPAARQLQDDDRPRQAAGRGRYRGRPRARRLRLGRDDQLTSRKAATCHDPRGHDRAHRADTALASRLPARSRWPAGTLAAAGTTPARTMNAYATLVFSQGHHPANHRSAIPTRAYESGSGHGHDAAPAGHPHPPRPPPEPGHPPRALAAHHRLRPPASRAPAASAPPSAPRPLTRATARTITGRDIAARAQLRSSFLSGDVSTVRGETHSAQRLDEPPDAGPHVRWCGRGRGNPAPYPITDRLRIGSAPAGRTASSSRPAVVGAASQEGGTPSGRGRQASEQARRPRVDGLRDGSE